MDGEPEIELDAEESDKGVNSSTINPLAGSTPSPSSSPAESIPSSNDGDDDVGANSESSRSRPSLTPGIRKRAVQEHNEAQAAYRQLNNLTPNSPLCKDILLKSAKKAGIKPRTLQSWIKQYSGTGSDSSTKDQNHSDDQEEKIKQETTGATVVEQDSSESLQTRPRRLAFTKGICRIQRRSARSRMPIVSGKAQSIAQASIKSPSYLTRPVSPVFSPSPVVSMSNSLGNSHHQRNSTNSSDMFVSIPNPLLNPQPSSLDHSSLRHSPIHTPQSMNVNGIPSNGDLTIQKMLEYVDEISDRRPSEDFSLLRDAMVRHEVSFIKLQPPPVRSSMNLISDLSSLSSPSVSNPTANNLLYSLTNEYITRMASQPLSHPHLAQFPSSDIGNLADRTRDPKYWALAIASAAAGFNIPGNGNSSVDNNRRRNPEPSNEQFSFASPKAPGTFKSKTVAATLAATRNTQSNIMSNYLPNPFDKGRRLSQKRKPSNGRMDKPCTITQPPPDEDYLDPMSILEVVTTKPSECGSHHNYTQESQGMDLSTTSPSVIHTNSSMITTSTTPTLRSKAMNKDYSQHGFLSSLGLVRNDKSPPNGHSRSSYSSTTNLEHFVQTVLPDREPSPSSPQGTSSSTSSSPPATDINSLESSDRIKKKVLEAYHSDPEVKGDKRKVARKLGVNIRVVEKLIRDRPTKSIPSTSIHGNGVVSSNLMKEPNPLYNIKIEQAEEYETVKNANNGRPLTTNGPTFNKRKNPNPFQICEVPVTGEMDDNGALDMDVSVPIKKRRVSSTPTSNSA